MREAVVIGAGIGGLAAAVGLRRRGWAVTVLERAARLTAVGAGVTLMTNGLRGLEALGVGEAVRAAGRADTPGGLRTSDGRWISRIDAGSLVRVLGTPAVGIHRATLHRILHDALPAGTVVTGAEAVEVTPGPAPVVRHRGDGGIGERRPALVVAADGINSATRARLWPELPPPVYTGSTSWRGVTAEAWRGELVTAVTWGRGTEFGMVPMGDGRVYWYAAVLAPAGGRDTDEMAAARQHVGGWHAPIPALLDATDPGRVIRTDLCHLRVPPPSYRRGAVALLGDAAHAMTPNLGQGANQAVEDAVVLAALCDPAGDVEQALDEYDRQRRPRASAVAAAALRAARFGQQLDNPAAVALRNTAMRLTPARVALRSMARHADWRPPPVPLAG